MHSKFSTLWMLCNAYDDMPSFSARSKHQRCYRIVLICLIVICKWSNQNFLYAANIAVVAFFSPFVHIFFLQDKLNLFSLIVISILIWWNNWPSYLTNNYVPILCTLQLISYRSCREYLFVFLQHLLMDRN